MTPTREQCLRRLAVSLTLVMLCNPMGPRGSSAAAAAAAQVQQQSARRLDESLDFNGAASMARRVNSDSSGEFQGSMMGGRLEGVERLRRQVSIPEGSPFNFGAPQLPQASQGGAGGGSNVLGFLSELGPQMAQAKSLTSLFGSGSQPQPQAPFQSLQAPLQSLQPLQPQQSAASSPVSSAAALMGQLSDMIRQARALSSSQQTSQPLGQRSGNAIQSGQGGIQSGLVEIGNALQRIALNNPNLLPDVNDLYRLVSSRLSSANSAYTQATSPQGQSQFAQGITNQIANPQPLPAPST